VLFNPASRPSNSTQHLDPAIQPSISTQQFNPAGQLRMYSENAGCVSGAIYLFEVVLHLPFTAFLNGSESCYKLTHLVLCCGVLQVLGVVENMSTLHLSLDALTFLNTAAAGSSSAQQADITAAVKTALQQALVDTGLVSSLSDVAAAADIFLPTGGGAARMCEQLGLQLLGKVPLDPLLGQAAEEGRSVLEAAGSHAVANGTSGSAGAANGAAAGPAAAPGRVPPSAAALQAIVQRVMQQVEAGASTK
jgi:hypothetical protein